MGLRDIFFNNRRIIQTLAMKSGIGEAKTFKTGEEIKRVSPIDLETIYVREGMVYNWINKTVESFLSSDFRVNTNNEREKRVMEEFLRNSDCLDLLSIAIQVVVVWVCAVGKSLFW